MSSSETFRPKSGLILSGCTFLLSVFLIWSAILTGALGATIAWSCVANILVYLIFIRPKVIYSDQGICIVNPIEEITIGWGDITLVDAKWCMSITSKHGRFNAWAAPAPSRHHSKKIHSSELRGMDIHGHNSISPARSPKSESGIAVHMAQVRLANFRGESSEFIRSKSWGGIFLLAVSVVAAIVLTISSS
jgi:hypothetical protein